MDYRKYGSTTAEQLKTMSQIIETLKESQEFSRKSSDFNHEMMLKLIDNQPTRVYKEQIEEKAYSYNSTAEEAVKYKAILKQDELIRNMFEIPNRHTFFVKTNNGPLVYCVKLLNT